MKTRHAILGMMAWAILAFHMGSILPTSTHLISISLSTGVEPNDDPTKSLEEQRNSLLKDPVYWIADTQDDYYERVYVDPTPLTYLRQNLSIKHYFSPVCGLYRFDTAKLPTVSVIMTMRHEMPGMASLTVHAILARTPPFLLVEIIIVDDSDKISAELKQLKKVSDKVIILATTQREGCARSRLIGARKARGTVLMFIDSHVEMLSSTWYQHLVLPIVENPHTIASQNLKVMGEFANHTYDGQASLRSHYGTTTDKFYFGYESYRFPNQTYQEGRTGPAPYEMPFGPGALFAIRKDEFWRLGGYDQGLYVWGGENMELSLKIWLCGGRLVQVPCSATGHMYRIHDKNKWDNDNFTELSTKLRIDGKGNYWAYGVKSNTGDMQRIWIRNNIRVAKVWLGDWRQYYYQQVFGSKELLGEWAKFEEEDEYMLEQMRFKEQNQCRDFDWFDKHVFMRLLGIHNPWYNQRKKDERRARSGLPDPADIRHTSCGNHFAMTCGQCPQGNGEAWCNGDCTWCKFGVEDEEVERVVVNGGNILSDKSRCVSKERQCRPAPPDVKRMRRADVD